MGARLSVDIDEELKRRVKIAAASKDQSIKEWVANALETALERTDEDREWLDQDLSNLGDIEPYDWAGDDRGKERPVAYEAGRGFVVVGGKKARER